MTENFALLFEQSLANTRIKPGTILMGRVIEVSSEAVVVSAGLKSEAVIPASQFKNDGDSAWVLPASVLSWLSSLNLALPSCQPDDARE